MFRLRLNWAGKSSATWPVWMFAHQTFFEDFSSQNSWTRLAGISE
jgi:hypothetical protein